MSEGRDLPLHGGRYSANGCESTQAGDEVLRDGSIDQNSLVIVSYRVPKQGLYAQKEDCMKLRFVKKIGPKVPEKLVVDVKVMSEDPDMDGLVIDGTSIWRGRKGDNYVSLPSRPSGGGKFYELLRYEDNPDAILAFKAKVLDEYEGALERGEVETIDLTPEVKAEAAAPAAS